MGRAFINNKMAAVIAQSLSTAYSNKKSGTQEHILFCGFLVKVK
jgi:hypothetical protein